MKIRNGFVANSSSSSYYFIFRDGKEELLNEDEVAAVGVHRNGISRFDYARKKLMSKNPTPNREIILEMGEHIPYYEECLETEKEHTMRGYYRAMLEQHKVILEAARAGRKIVEIAAGDHGDSGLDGEGDFHGSFYGGIVELPSCTIVAINNH